jgi:hypothetical protein
MRTKNIIMRTTKSKSDICMKITIVFFIFITMVLSLMFERNIKRRDEVTYRAAMAKPNAPIFQPFGKTKWDLSFNNRVNYSLFLTINKTDIIGYYIAPEKTNKLTGTIINNQFNLSIPDVAGFTNNVCMKLEGKMINNKLVGIKTLYVCNKVNWTEKQLTDFKKDFPDEPFSATKINL